MTFDYSIENLVKTFHDHAVLADKHNENSKKVFQEEFPEQELPDFFKQEFNISRALCGMCKEMKSLNEWVIDHMRNDH